MAAKLTLPLGGGNLTRRPCILAGVALASLVACSRAGSSGSGSNEAAAPRSGTLQEPARVSGTGATQAPATGAEIPSQERAGPAGTGARTEAAEAARVEIERLVERMNRSIDEWDGPAYLAPLAQTETLIFLGSDSTELSLGYQPIAAEILEGFAAARAGGRSGRYRHTGLSSGATADGKAGWWLQEMEYRFRGEDGLRAYPFRISGFALKGETEWRVYLAHASLPVPADEVWRFLRPPARGTPVAALETKAGPASGEAELRRLVGELAGLYNARNFRGWLDLFAEEPDVGLIGWEASEVATSREAIASYLEQFGSRYPDPGFLISDSVVVRSLPDAGWWYEKGRLRFGTALDLRELPFRSTGAAVRRKGGWQIVQWHAGIPVPNDSTGLFSHPVSD